MAKGDVLVRMKADVGNYNANMASARRALQSFKDENLTVGGIVTQLTRSFTAYAAGLTAVGALGSKLAQTVSESVALAKSAEGVREAFGRLNNPNLLRGLREATHGTVADIELMQAAVKFNDFNLPVEELGTMLAFAQQKAKDTGQSIDYMVDSIVTGLGRKSLMILDNLGLSASEIKERMGETGDMTKAVGEIIRDQMDKAGGYVETAADRAAQAAAATKNKMEEFGRAAMPAAEAWSETWSIIKNGALDLLNNVVTPLVNKLTEAGRLRANLNSLQGDGEQSTVDKQIEQLSRGSQIQKWAIYRQQMASYRNEIEHLQSMAAAWGRWRGDRSNVTAADRALISESRDKYNTTSVSELERTATNLKKMMDEYMSRALPIIRPKQQTPSSGDSVVNPPSTYKPIRTKTTHADEPTAAAYSIAGLTAQMQALRKEQEQVTSTSAWEEYQRRIFGVTDAMKMLRGELSPQGLGAVSFSDMGRKSVEAAQQSLKDKKLDVKIVQPKEEKADVKANEILGDISSALGNMVSGIEGLGIEIPKDIKNMLGALNSITMILTSIEAFQKVGALLGIFSHGGVVKAASGYTVPGRRFSGDMIPARLNAGETVLNQAQAGIIASALQDRDFSGGMGGQPYTNGENIILGINNTYKRKGMGEIVTTSMLKHMGLMN